VVWAFTELTVDVNERAIIEGSREAAKRRTPASSLPSWSLSSTLTRTSRWCGSRPLAKGGQKCFEILADEGRIRMIRPKTPFGSRQRAAKERLGFAEAVSGFEQQREIIETLPDIGMIRAISLLPDRQCAAKVSLGFAEPVRGVEQKGKIVEAVGHNGMIGSVTRLVDHDRAAKVRLCFPKPVRSAE
jgi:hypothetical protein